MPPAALHSTDHKPDLTCNLPAEADTLALGSRIARGLVPGMVLHLSGELGAGKTTLVRGILRALGYAGAVKSPTLTLVEVYEVSRLYLYHFDLYRFNDPSELGEAGFREYFNPAAVCLVEWPEKAAGFLPQADIVCEIQYAGTGRQLSLQALTAKGSSMLQAIAEESL